MVLHLVHVEAELWAAVVGDQTDTDSGLAQVGLQEEVVDKVLHLLEVLSTDGGRLIQDDEEVEIVIKEAAPKKKTRRCRACGEKDDHTAKDCTRCSTIVTQSFSLSLGWWACAKR